MGKVPRVEKKPTMDQDFGVDGLENSQPTPVPAEWPSQAGPQADYKENPGFQRLMAAFQSADWQACRLELESLLAASPEDGYLLAFKDDVEVRLALQENEQTRRTQEKRSANYRTALRLAMFAAWGILVGIGFVWALNAYTAHITRTSLEREATLLEQTLADKYLSAESFYRLGKLPEALVIYQEIAEIRPDDLQTRAKIQDIQENLAVRDLYRQGLESLKSGDRAKALQIMLEVEARQPGYENAAEVAGQIQKENQLAQLAQTAQTAYHSQDWPAVIQAAEAMQVLDPFAKFPEMESILFTSYRNIIIDIASRPDASAAEIELAEKYYRAALALAPQDKKFAAEREELNKIALRLQASKYYWHGMELLESSHYSLTGVEQALQLLNQASSLGSDSAVFRAGQEKTQLFYEAYTAFLQRRWTASLAGFEQLHRQEARYANGFLEYLLFEASLAHGDNLLIYADYSGALNDYQEAEKYLWEAGKNAPLRRFQNETRIARALGKLWRSQEAAEYYHFAFEELQAKYVLSAPGQKSLLAAIDNANQALDSGDVLEAVQRYELALEMVTTAYPLQQLQVRRGETLAYVAFKYGTTIEALRQINHLDENLVFTADQQILVPVSATEQ